MPPTLAFATLKPNTPINSTGKAQGEGKRLTSGLPGRRGRREGGGREAGSKRDRKREKGSRGRKAGRERDRAGGGDKNTQNTLLGQYPVTHPSQACLLKQPLHGLVY